VVWFVANQLNEQLTEITEQLHCPCSRYSCLRHNSGYKIGIALMKKIKPGTSFDDWDAQEQSEKYGQFVHYRLWLFND